MVVGEGGERELKKDVTLRLTGRQHAILQEHLLTNDGKEAVALALCGRRDGEVRHQLVVHRVVLIPNSECYERRQGLLYWPTEKVMPLVNEAAKRQMAILKIHSHPGGYEDFSLADDNSDRNLFSSIHGWIDDDLPHASAVMLPDGRVFGRSIWSDGEFASLICVSVAGDDLNFWHAERTRDLVVPQALLRNLQTFGRGTVEQLQRLKIAIVGCSGTGSIVAEQLARLGTGELVLVDPDKVEEKNLNRILNAFMRDALQKKSKVSVVKGAIDLMGLETRVTAIPQILFEPGAAMAVADCDIVFGCMDAVDGRNLLNHIAAFYNIPYFDLGVRLDADGYGGVNIVCGSVHYLQPDGSSLLSRGVFTPEEIRVAGLRRTNPNQYKDEVRSKYIRGLPEDRPAVISVNMQIASIAVNELIARLHPYRNLPNQGFAVHGVNFVEGVTFKDVDGHPCQVLSRLVGRGDMIPLLNTPELSSLD
jgi:hypothetical protein